jgi:hypothetical protein
MCEGQTECRGSACVRGRSERHAFVPSKAILSRSASSLRVTTGGLAPTTEPSSGEKGTLVWTEPTIEQNNCPRGEAATSRRAAMEMSRPDERLRHRETDPLRNRAAVAIRNRAPTTARRPTSSGRPRRRFTSADRFFWASLSQVWRGWRSAVHIIKPETVIAWHRRGFRLFWTWKSRHRPGRPGVPPRVRALIREVSSANPLWGAPRIHGELHKLGISVSESTVAKYMRRHQRPRPKRGGHSSPITSVRSWPPTSSSCRPSRSGCCSYS